MPKNLMKNDKQITTSMDCKTGTTSSNV